MSIETLANPSNLSEVEIRGLSRMILALKTPDIVEDRGDYNRKIRSLIPLLPYLHVQCPYDSTDSRSNTSPLSVYSRVSRFDPRKTTLDTRFARENVDGMRKDIIDYEKEHKAKSEMIADIETNKRRRQRGESSEELLHPDFLTVDIDHKTSLEVVKVTHHLLRRLGMGMVAVVGTSRKPEKEYKADIAQYSIDMTQTVIDADLNDRLRVITGVGVIDKMSEFCDEKGIELACTGSFLPEFDIDRVFVHAGGVDLRDVAGNNAKFIIGTPIFEAPSPYDAVLRHAEVLGQH